MSDATRRSFLKAAARTVAAVAGAGLAASAARAGSPLSNDEIIRAWKDQAFRNGLTPEQREQLPMHPAGTIEIEDQDLDETILNPSAGRKSRKNCCY